MQFVAKVLLASSLVVSTGCSAEIGAPPEVPDTPDEAATVAAGEAIDVTALLADVSQLIGDGFTPSLIGGALGGPVFTAPAGCTASFELGLGSVALEHDCTLPSGRHVHGLLQLGFGSECGLGGLSVDFELLVESQAGADDELSVKGHVALSHQLGRIYMATSLEKIAHPGEHEVEALVGACVVLDLPSHLLAADGAVSLRVDSELIALFRVSDLQHLLCDPVPYQGSVLVQHRDEIVEVVFDRDTPSTGLVTVITSKGTSQLELPIPFAGVCSGGEVPLPVDIDYQSCGGCGNPVPPDDPEDPDDPIPQPPDPPEIE